MRLVPHTLVTKPLILKENNLGVGGDSAPPPLRRWQATSTAVFVQSPLTIEKEFSLDRGQKTKGQTEFFIQNSHPLSIFNVSK